MYKNKKVTHPPKEATEPVAWWSDGTITKGKQETGEYREYLKVKQSKEFKNLFVTGLAGSLAALLFGIIVFSF